MTLDWRSYGTRGALLLMESLLVYGVVALLVAAAGEGGNPSPFGVIAIVFISYGMSRFLQGTELSLGLLKIWGAVLSFLIFYMIIRIDFFNDLRFWDFTWADSLFNHTGASIRDNDEAVVGIPILWAAWIRGILRGQDHIGFEDIVSTFAIGIIIVGVVELIADGVEDVPAGVGIIAVPYVAVGLLAIGLAHLSRSEDEPGRSFTPTWLIAVGGAVLLISGFALLFVLIDLSTAASLLGEAGQGFAWVFLKVLEVVLWPIFKAIELMVLAIKWFSEHVLGGERIQNPQGNPNPEPQEDDGSSGTTLPAWARLLTRVLVGGILVGLLLIATLYMFSRVRRRFRPPSAKESTYQEGRLASDLGDLLGSLLGRLRPNIHFGGDDLDAARRLYQEVLAAGAQRGIQRKPPQTPLELSPLLNQSFAGDTPGRITAVFDDVRYGGQPPPEAEVKRLRDEWEQLRKT